MALYSIDDCAPQLEPDAWAAPSADMIGDVRLAARASVWFGAVIRADNTPILVGEESNIQDGAIGHSDPGYPLTIGARVTAKYGGKQQAQEVLAQSSFYSANDPRLHFGLGAAETADLEIRWPNGGLEKIRNIAADQLVTIREGAGIVKRERFGSSR